MRKIYLGNYLRNFYFSLYNFYYPVDSRVDSLESESKNIITPDKGIIPISNSTS